MLLLEMVPEFQKDIAELRQHFGIPRSGYRYDNVDDLPENRARKTREQLRQTVDKKVETIGGYFMPPRTDAENMSFEIDPESLKGWAYKIGEKFCLPYNLYNSAFWGVGHYALWNEILLLPRNWELLNDPRDGNRSLMVRWVAIRAYAPLDEDESREAIATLNSTLRQNFPVALGKQRRVHSTDEDNLAYVAQIIEQRKNGVKSFSDGSRKKLERANGLARALFGYSLKSRRHKKTGQ